MNDMSMARLGNAASQRSGSPIGSAEIELRIGGMAYPHCPASIEEALRELEGVSQAHVSLADGAAHVAYDPSRVKVLDLIKAIRAAGYSAGTFDSISRALMPRSCECRP